MADYKVARRLLTDNGKVEVEVICLNCGEETVKPVPDLRNGKNLWKCMACYFMYFYSDKPPSLEAYSPPEILGWKGIPKGTLLILKETQL